MLKPQKDITAVLVVHNEGKYVERCLSSVKKVTNNILVIHDGPCKDNTLNICNKYGCKIHIRDFIGEAEPHRAWAFSQADSVWILQIDADEYLSNKLIKNIPNLINNNSVDCWELLWPYYNGKKYCTKKWPYKKALFKKSKIQFIASPHEEVHVDGLVKRCPYRLEHKPNYDNFTFKQFFTKHIRWINLHAHYISMDGDKLDRYPKNNNLKPHYSFLKNHPLLFSIPIFVYHFGGLLYYGGKDEGFYGIRNSFFQALYYFFLCLRLYLQKIVKLFNRHFGNN